MADNLHSLTFLITLVFSLLVVGSVIWGLSHLRQPSYRLRPDNVRRLLDLVLAGEASASDWEVFVGLPIRHNPELDAVRQRCAAVAEREYIGHLGNSPYLFTQRGLEQLAEIREELTA